METCDRAPHGLWSGRSVVDFLTQLKGWGFNALRIPVSPQVLRNEGTVANWTQVGDPDYPQEPFEGLKYFLRRTQKRGYTKQDWFQDLRRMAQLSLEFPNIFGIDLANKPYNLTWVE